MDVLGEILLRNGEKDVDSIKLISKEINNLSERIQKDREYWRRKLSYRLGFEVFDLEDESWKKMYLSLFENVEFWNYLEGQFPDTILVNAIDADYAEIVKKLIHRTYDPNKKGENEDSFITYASAIGSKKTAKMFLEDSRIDPTQDHNLPIKAAFKNNNFDVVKLLLEDSRVRNSLTHWEINKYEELLE